MALLSIYQSEFQLTVLQFLQQQVPYHWNVLVFHHWMAICQKFMRVHFTDLLTWLLTELLRQIRNRRWLKRLLFSWLRQRQWKLTAPLIKSCRSYSTHFHLANCCGIFLCSHVHFEENSLFIPFCGGLLSSRHRATVPLWTDLFLPGLTGWTASTLCLVDLVTLILIDRCLEVWQ